MKNIYLLILLQLLSLVVLGQNFKVGDKVEAYNSGAWYKGTISQIGANSYKGYYYVQWEKYSQGQWIKETNIRLYKNATINSIAPRNGIYIILSYGNPTNPIRIGYFDLINGQYNYYNAAKKIIGKGSFTYNANNKTVVWTSGPFKDAKWNGVFEIDREGKTHKIRLNNSTIGANSTDSYE